MMKITEHIKKAVRIVALSGLACVSAGMLGGCTAEEDFAADERVTVTGIEVGIGDAVESRADAANESPDAKGYIGAEKVIFVATDKIEVKVGDGSPVTFTAESDGGSGLKWTTNSEIVLSKGNLNGAGVKVTATHTATESGDDKPLGDDLTAENTNVTFGASEPEDGSITINTDGKLKISFKHQHSLVSASVTTDMGTVASVVVNYGESQSVALNGSKAILPVGSVIKSFTIKFSGDNAPSSMTLDIPSPVTTEANTHYPFKITASAGKTEVTLLNGNVLPGWSEGELSGGVIKIGTFAELAAVVTGEGGADNHYVLTRDLDFTNNDHKGDYSGDTWTPIGDNTNEFYGKFNGNGHTISNLTISSSDAGIVGLFSKVADGGVIHDLHLNNATITVTSESGENVGGIAGLNEGRIDYCSVTGGEIKYENNSPTTETAVGGIVGHNKVETGNAIITRCWVKNVTVNAIAGSAKAYAGGIAGANEGTGRIIACYALGGSVSATNNSSSDNCYAGGFVGYNNGHIMACYAKGANVTATNSTNTEKVKAGAFCGANPGDIGYSYATTNVTKLKFSGTYKDADGSKVSDANGNYNVDVNGKEIAKSDIGGYESLTQYDSKETNIGSVKPNTNGSLDLSDTGSAWLNKNIWVWPSGTTEEVKKTTPPTIDMTYNGDYKKQ